MAAGSTRKLRRLAVLLAFVSQGIHLWVLICQLAVAVVPGAFFFWVAVNQGLLGASLLLGGGRWTARFGILLNMFVVLVWIVTRTLDVPQLFEPIRLPVDGLGTVATMTEFTLVGVLVALERSIPRKKGA
jgi:membrane protein implicated in regulation of membrane protease activity